MKRAVKKGSKEQMVMAHDGSGRMVLTPKSQTVEIPICPVAIDMDNGTPRTPILARFFNDPLPHKLISIEPPGTLKEELAPERQADGNVEYKDKLVPIKYWRVNYEYKTKPRNRKSKADWIHVFNLKDACDPYFDGLSANERVQIREAVESSRMVSSKSMVNQEQS